MAPTVDPIRVVDARELRPGSFDLAKVTRRVNQDLKDFNRALKEKGFAVEDDDMPSEEVVAGYVSNVRGHLFNETRRMKEVVVDLSATPANKASVLQWIRQLGLNDNVFDLSITTHGRAAARAAILDYATKNGVEHFAMVVPSSSEESLSVNGVLSEQVGKIRKTSEWLDISKELNRDRKGLSLIFSLGLHHNDPHQMLPVTPGKLAAAVKVMAEYRKKLLARLRRRAQREEG